MGCWHWRRDSHKLRAFSQGMGHVVAWAGIEAFGNLRFSTYFQDQSCDAVDCGGIQGHLVRQILLIFSTAAFLMVFGMASWFLRRHIVRATMVVERRQWLAILLRRRQPASRGCIRDRAIFKHTQHQHWRSGRRFSMHGAATPCSSRIFHDQARPTESGCTSS